MEVLVGPTFGIKVAASSTYARERPKEKISSSCLFIKEDQVGGGSDRGSADLSSDSSSSIESPGDSDVKEEEEDGVVSSGGSGGLASLASIEDSLPIKRGLSNHYVGKSKSFANLSDINSVKELQKVESPFNKRRRLLLANKWCRSRSRKSSFYSWQNPNSMPLLALVEEDDEDTENKQTPSDDKIISVTATEPKLQQRNLRASFNSQSCFSLTDLHVEIEHQ